MTVQGIFCVRCLSNALPSFGERSAGGRGHLFAPRAPRSALRRPYLAKATGRNGSVIVYEDRVRITRKSWIWTVTSPLKDDLVIPMEDIVSVVIATPGYLPGHIVIYESGIVRHGDAAGQRNAVIFDSDEYEEFKRIKDFIDELRRPGNDGVEGATEMLRERYAAGELTEGEYQERKRMLEER